MLYVTTRSKHDVYTAHVTLRQDRGPDGGCFLPFRMPFFEKDEILALKGRSFGQNVADILDLFFSAKLTAWDVEMVVGRTPIKLRSMNYRVIVAELWNQMDQTFRELIRGLSEKLHPDHDLIGDPSEWSEMAVRIAVLFGVYGELLKAGHTGPELALNVAFSSGSFSGPMSAWYARQMGLPIDTVICGCNENGGLWELLHRGELECGAVALTTDTPESDHAVPPQLERLIHGACGHEEVQHFYWCCTEGAVYAPAEEAYDDLRRGMFAAVVSKGRVETIIPSVYRTSRYILDPYAALAYGALTDHRSRTGNSTTTLLLSEHSPISQRERMLKIMHISSEELRKRISEV